MCHETKVTQQMVFPKDHPDFPDMPKGMKHVLIEQSLWCDNLRMQCKSCSSDHCCARQILGNQPDFKAQKSLVQEVIESAGHLCIFLPKFHCELNFIEYFWAVVKKYLHNNCDYTFATLQANMPKALASGEVHTIQKWEHQMKRGMEAYEGGLGAKDAQFQVQAFSSRKYKSHRHVPETVASVVEGGL